MFRPSFELELSSDRLAAIDQAMTDLEADLTALTGLCPADRRNLTKMGDKSEKFCRLAAAVFALNPDVMPRNFDQAAFARLLATLDALRPILARTSRLQQRLRDSEMLVRNQLMRGALDGYAVLKVSAQGKGMDSLRAMMSARFRRSRTRNNSASEAAPPTPQEPAVSQSAGPGSVSRSVLATPAGRASAGRDPGAARLFGRGQEPASELAESTAQEQGGITPPKDANWRNQPRGLGQGGRPWPPRH